jgi:cation diffusion facilitator CzcD-associated flavoprotein CzcO
VPSRTETPAEEFDAAGGVDRIWYWNRYPSAPTDSPHSLFSIYPYSFSDELAREWEFTERYPGQPEVLHCLNWVAGLLDLRRSFGFDTWSKPTLGRR